MSSQDFSYQLSNAMSSSFSPAGSSGSTSSGGVHEPVATTWWNGQSPSCAYTPQPMAGFPQTFDPAANFPFRSATATNDKCLNWTRYSNMGDYSAEYQPVNAYNPAPNEVLIRPALVKRPN